MCPIVRERSHSARFARRASCGALRYAGEKEDDRRKTIFPLQRTAVPKWNRRCQFLGTCSDGRPACKAVNFRCGSKAEVQREPRNVRSWGSSGSRFRATGCLLVAKSRLNGRCQCPYPIGSAVRKTPSDAARSALESSQDLSNQIWGSEKGEKQYS